MAKKEPKKRGFTIQGFDAAAYKRTEDYVRAVDRIYMDAVDDFSHLASSLNIDTSKPFSFKDYPTARTRAQNIITGMTENMKSVIVRGSRNQWLFACEKNDAFLAHILDTSKIKPKTLAKYQDRNLDALTTFQNRKVDGLGLSQRIWRYTDQFKAQMELGIDIGIGDGRSAKKLSQDLRQYLVDPDKLFHRVRNKHGNLVLSKNAQAFHPGQGKYRSSYKNAMRLTRSEINMAYRESDETRWNKLDFVVGYEVRLSNNHTLNGVPFYDVCNVLQGKYPKGFKFVGWHPQCRCHVIPILMDPDEFNTDELNELKSAINGTEYKKFASRNTVTEVPGSFADWIKDNAQRSKGWKSQPFFVRDNFVGGNIAGGLKEFEKAPIKPPKPIKSPEQKADIQKRWNTRQATNKYGAEIQSITDEFGGVEAIKAYSEKIKAQIKAGAPLDNVSTMVGRLKHKVEVKKAWEIRKVENSLNKYIPDPKGSIATYGLESVQTVYSAVEKKMAQFDLLPVDQKKKKLLYEIQWVGENKKYSTWQLAQEAYKKQLTKVEYLIDKQAVNEAAIESLSFAHKSKSPIVKKLATEFNTMLNKDASITALKSKLKELDDKVASLNKDAAAKAAKKLKSAAPADWNNPETYSKARKDAALWAKEADEADKKLRDVCGTVWQSATKAEREAAYYYTHTYSSINEPLRGIPYYGGKSLTTSQAKVPHLSSIIEKSSYDFDMWVQRGVGSNGFKGVFGVDIYSLDTTKLKTLVGKEGTEKAFSSCGVAKGKGFSGSEVIYNIYCPKGTKMLYAEPFSQYGHGGGASWDGISKQSYFGSEAEIIIQKNTRFRIIKAEYSRGRYYIDIEVIGQ